MPSKPQYTVVVPAAGVGKRMQADIPKQYLLLAGKAILTHTLECLISHPQIEHIVLVLHPQDPYFDELAVSNAEWITRVDGGKERADSVLAGLRALTSDEWVLVHDAARPCLSHEDLDKLLILAEQGEIGGILATPVRDTMKRAHSRHTDLVDKTECRENLWHALTPQFFPTAELLQALEEGLAKDANITDEASAIEWAGGQVKLVEASPQNLKITRPDDLQLAEFYLKNRNS